MKGQMKIQFLSIIVILSMLLGAFGLPMHQVTAANNEFVTENNLPGNPPSVSDVNGAGDASLQGSAPDLNKGPGGPILVITDATNTTNPFGPYYAEILRAEGFNAFNVLDISDVSAATLATYNVVLLSEMSLDGAQVSMFSTWVNGGGKLIAFRPDKALATLCGLTDASGTISEGYLAVNTTTSIGQGVVGDTLQFHGMADQYTLSTGSASLATLYSNATTPTAYPAITRYTSGSGQVVVFTFDLAKSIVLMRQGNPAWAYSEGDGITGIRASDMFVHSGQPNWVDTSKLLIPQGDEQMHVLSHAIEQLNNGPTPRLWYFPGLTKGALIMTGDSEGCNDACVNAPMADVNSHGGTYTAYLLGTPNSPASVTAWGTAGNGVAPHYDDTANAENPTVTTMDAVYDAATPIFTSTYGVTPRTTRNHWIVWTGWSEQAEIEVDHGIKLDTNYYHYGSWLTNPGYFTGSGLPMRFSDEFGSVLDIFQATTQLPDEWWNQAIAATFQTLIDRSIDQGYYGFLTANFHPPLYGGYQTVAGNMMDYANSRGVPIWSAEKLLDFLQARNQALTQNIVWSENETQLTFDYSYTATIPDPGLTLMVPAQAGGKTLLSVKIGETAVPYAVQNIKGYDYALFTATSGSSYAALYGDDETAPTVLLVSPLAAATGVAVGTAVTAQFSEPMNPATITDSTFELRNTTTNALIDATVSYNSTTHTAILRPNADLAPSTQFTAKVIMAVDDVVGVRDVAGNPLAADFSWSFTTGLAEFSIWDGTGTPANPNAIDTPHSIGTGVKFRSDIAGYITGVRFYKGTSNTGTHTGFLWSSTGTQLATATFTNESASGWQQVYFASPVPILANTTYVASYYSPIGYFAYTQDYFLNSGVVNGHLTALQAGVDGPNGVYRYDSAEFPSLGSAANYWVDVVFTTSDSFPPVISNIHATPGLTGTTATITWSTNEPATSQVDYGTVQPFTLNASDPVLVTSHSITLTGLTPSTTYFYQVSSADAFDNTATSQVLTFTTPVAQVGDDLAADFSAGDLSSCTYVAETANGELILKPASGAEFSGIALDAGWQGLGWDGSGLETIADGLITLDFDYVRTTSFFSAPRAIEFSATFTASPNQHAGFGDTLNTGSWAIFSTGPDGIFRARTNQTGAGDTLTTDLGQYYLGSPQLFRIEWGSGSINYYINGTSVASHPLAITNQMRPIASDGDAVGVLTVDWMRMSPYTSPCTFTSRVLDAGSTVNWQSLNWTAGVPAGTTLAFSYRVGDTPTPDGTWSSFINVSNSGDLLTTRSRYAQYRVTLTALDPSVTPNVQNVFFTYTSDADTTAPAITSRSPGMDATDVALDSSITVIFSELLDPATVIGANVYLYKVGGTTPIPATVSRSAGNVITLDPTSALDPGSSYTVSVTIGITDLAGIHLGTSASWNFTTIPITIMDSTFQGGSGCYLANTAGGEINLEPTVGAEFGGTTLPANWEWAQWGTGGSASVNNGNLIVETARAYYNAPFSPGHSLQFYATFTASVYQHIGWATAVPDFFSQFAIFSTFGSTTNVYARTSDGDWSQNLGTLVGSPHLYRIDWTGSNITFFVDGVQVATHDVSLTNMFPIVSDSAADTQSAQVDWIRMTPYISPCTFTSRVLDASSIVAWDRVSWVGSTPTSTNLAVSYRIGNTPTPDASWTAFAPATNSPTLLTGLNSRYVQYQVVLSTTDPNQTPLLESVSFAYHPNPTGVDLNYFRAEKASEGILLSWETVSEATLVGFNLYRREISGEFIKINAELIPPQNGGLPEGSAYTYLDDQALPDIMYEYRLDGIESTTLQVSSSALATYWPFKIMLPLVTR